MERFLFSCSADLAEEVFLACRSLCSETTDSYQEQQFRSPYRSFSTYVRITVFTFGFDTLTGTFPHPWIRLLAMYYGWFSWLKVSSSPAEQIVMSSDIDIFLVACKLSPFCSNEYNGQYFLRLFRGRALI